MDTRLITITALACVAALAPACLLLADPPLLTDEDSSGSGGGSGGGGAAPSFGWTDLAIDYSTVCALDGEGAMWCGDPGQLSLEDAGPFVSISDGEGGICAVAQSGTLRCGFGLFSDGFGLSETYLEVSGGTSAGCGLMTSGAARCWPAPTNVNGPFTTLGAGDDFACGILSGGALACWGTGGVIFDEAIDNVPAGSFSRVATDSHVGCAISSANGDISCWGYDFYGLLVGPPDDSYVDLDFSFQGACALTSTGSLVCWGEGSGDPNNPQFFPPHESFVRVALGSGVGCGITSDTQLVCW